MRGLLYGLYGARNCRWDAYEIDNEGKNRGGGGGKATAMGGL